MDITFTFFGNGTRCKKWSKGSAARCRILRTAHPLRRHDLASHSPILPRKKTYESIPDGGYTEDSEEYVDAHQGIVTVLAGSK